MQQEKFLIVFHANDLAHPSSFIVNMDGESRQVSYRDEPDGLTQIAEGKEVVVVVPSCDVLHTTLKLPKMSRSRLLKAIPFALEEYFLEDVQELHFVLHEQKSNDGDYPLSVVAKKKIEEWLSLLQSWNIKPDVFLPEVLCLPFNDSTWHIAILEMALVRTSWCHGFAMDKHNFFEVLNTAMNTSIKIPETLNIKHSEDQIFSSSGPYNIKQIKCTPEEILNSMATVAVQSRAINLLQGRYSNKKFIFPQVKKIWKWNAYLGMVCLTLFFIYPITSYFILKQNIDQTHQQIAEIYKQHFKDSTHTIAVKTRMEEKLKRIMAEKNASLPLTLLAEIAKAKAKASNIKLKRFDFTNNQLSLELSAPSSEDFSTFIEFLAGEGLRIKEQNATLVGTSIDATLEIEGK